MLNSKGERSQDDKLFALSAGLKFFLPEEVFGCDLSFPTLLISEKSLQTTDVSGEDLDSSEDKGA